MANVDPDALRRVQSEDQITDDYKAYFAPGDVLLDGTTHAEPAPAGVPDARTGQA